MGTLLVGLLLVTVSAAGFGLALFGRRPLPQPATQLASTPFADRDTPPVATYRSPEVGQRSVRERLPAPSRLLGSRRTADVTLSTWVRVRSALILGLTVVGLAGIIGGALSVVVVGLVLVLT